VLTTTGNNEIPGLFNQANANLVFYYPQVTLNSKLAIENQAFASNLLKIGISNPALGLYSQTAVKQSGVLASLIDDRCVRIIKGADPLSAVSDLISSWQSQGRSQIARDYANQMSKQS
jgi:putative aldouronate transport system substrate-binding protein